MADLGSAAGTLPAASEGTSSSGKTPRLAPLEVTQVTAKPGTTDFSNPANFPTVSHSPRLDPLDDTVVGRRGSEQITRTLDREETTSPLSLSLQAVPVVSQPAQVLTTVQIVEADRVASQHIKVQQQPLASIHEKTESDLSIPEDYVTGPGALVNTYIVNINGSEFTVNFFDSIIDGYVLVALDTTAGTEYSCPFPTLKDARGTFSYLPDILEAADDFYEVMVQKMTLVPKNDSEELQLAFQYTAQTQTFEPVILHTELDVNINGEVATVVCSKLGDSLHFTVSLNDSDEIFEHGVPTSKLRIANILSDLPDLMMSDSETEQMKALVPTLTLYRDPHTLERYLAFYLGSQSVTIEGEELIMTIIEHENEIWVALFNPMLHKEFLVVIDGRDWMNFKMQMDLCVSRYILFRNVALRLIKVEKTELDAESVDDSYMFLILDQAPANVYLIRRRSLEQLPIRCQWKAVEVLERVSQISKIPDLAVVNRRLSVPRGISIEDAVKSAKEVANERFRRLSAAGATEKLESEILATEEARIAKSKLKYLRSKSSGASSSKNLLTGSPKGLLVSRKSMLLMGALELAPEKAGKFLGKEMTTSQKKAQSEAEAIVKRKGIPIAEALEQVNNLRMFSKEELKEKNIKANAKVLGILGDEMIISKKAAKLIGSPMDTSQHRKMLSDRMTVYVKSEAEIQEELRRQAIYSADKVENKFITRKAQKLLGDGALLIGPKTRKLLGEEMSSVQTKKMYEEETRRRKEGDSMAETMEQINFHRKISAPAIRMTLKSDNKDKVLKLTGEVLVVAGEKAEKILGGEMEAAQKRKMAKAQEEDKGPSAEEITWQVEMKKRISAEDYQDGSTKQHSHIKVMQLTGEALLAGNKAEKLIGDQMEADAVRKMQKAEIKEKETGLTEAEIEWQLEMKKRISAEEYLQNTTKQHSSVKVAQLTGESMLAGTKAEKLLGSEMTPEQKKAALRAHEEEILRIENPTEEEAMAQMRIKRVYSRDEYQMQNAGKKTSAKAMALMGDVLLSSDKALRLMGDDKHESAKQSFKEKDKEQRSSLLAKLRPNMAKLIALTTFQKSGAKTILKADKPVPKLAINERKTVRTPSSYQRNPFGDETPKDNKAKGSTITKDDDDDNFTLRGGSEDGDEHDMLAMIMNESLDEAAIPMSTEKLNTLHLIMEICLTAGLSDVEANNQIQALLRFSEQSASMRAKRKNRELGTQHNLLDSRNSIDETADGGGHSDDDDDDDIDAEEARETVGSLDINSHTS